MWMNKKELLAQQKEIGETLFEIKRQVNQIRTIDSLIERTFIVHHNGRVTKVRADDFTSYTNILRLHLKQKTVAEFTNFDFYTVQE